MSDTLSSTCLRGFDVQVFGLTAFPHAVFFNPKSFSVLFVYFRNVVAFDLSGKKGVFMFPLHRVTSELFCCVFRKSCKDFYIMKSDGLYITNAMKPWFCYKQFIFVLYWTFLCNTTDRSIVANRRLYSLLTGALLSQSYQTLSHVVTQSAFSVCLHLPFDILRVMTMVNVTEARVASRQFLGARLCSLNTRFENTAFHFLGYFFLHSVTTYIRVSVSHALRGTESDFLMDCLN